MEVGKYIKFLRIQKGVSQEELGKVVGVQRAAVQKWESGATPNLKRITIQKLADYFDVKPCGFVSDDLNESTCNSLYKLSSHNKNTEPPIIIEYNKLNNTRKEKKELTEMPELSRFFNIIIRMIYNDTSQHHKPHIHVQYNEYEATIGIDGELLAGSLPVKQLRLVEAWIVIHEEELYKAWNNAVRSIPFDKIAPLS